MRIIPVALASVALVAAAGAAATTQDEPDVTIRIQDYRFNPEAVEIRAGQTIRWENTSQILHTVTADPRRVHDPEDVALPEGAEPFNSGELQPRKTYRRRFTVPGTYKYFCIPHQEMGMTGTIVVKEAPTGGG